MTTTIAPPQPEPWLRGTYSDLPAVLRAVLHAFDLAQEDIAHWTADLSEAELHATPYGLTSIALHLRHIPRSLDRLLTYAEGNQLSSEQIIEMKTECDDSVSRDELFSELNAGLGKAARRVRAFAEADLETPCAIGKKQLPTTIGGLLVHLADHTQRHTGQIVTTARLLKGMRLEESTGIHGLT